MVNPGLSVRYEVSAVTVTVKWGDSNYLYKDVI